MGFDRSEPMYLILGTPGGTPQGPAPRSFCAPRLARKGYFCKSLRRNGREFVVVFYGHLIRIRINCFPSTYPDALMGLERRERGASVDGIS